MHDPHAQICFLQIIMAQDCLKHSVF